MVKRGERGFTLIEVIVSVAIMSAIVAGVSMTTITFLTHHQRSTSQNVVLTQVQNAGYWISRDVQVAETVTPGESNGFPLTLVIPVDTNPDNNYSVSYSFDSDKLIRQANGSSNTVIAEYINVEATTFSILASENYELLEKLTELYLNASNPDRQKIRIFLKDIKRWNEVFQHWRPNKNLITENPELYLKLLLANQSMLDGGPDYRDTILTLAPTWHMLEELGIDPEPIFQEAKAWGGDLEISINNVLHPELQSA